MNLTSVYISIGILALILLPFYIYSIRKKTKSGQLTRDFIAIGIKYGIEISEHDLWRDRMVGIDPLQRKILFRYSKENDLDETLVDLTQVASSSLETTYLRTAGNENVIDKIDLVFRFRGNAAPVSLSFYNSDTDLTVYSEYELGEKWQKICSNLLA